MNDLADRPLMGHEDPRIRALFEIFKKRLDRICDETAGTPVCAGHGHIKAIETFFEAMKPHVINIPDSAIFMLFNPGPVDAYAIKNPSNSIKTILIDREFGDKILALKGLP